MHEELANFCVQLNYLLKKPQPCYLENVLIFTGPSGVAVLPHTGRRSRMTGCCFVSSATLTLELYV